MVKPSFLSGIQPTHAQNATDRACARSAWVGAGDKPSSVGPGGFRVPLPGWRTCRGVRPFLCARACARAGAVYPPPSARTGRRAGVAGERELCDLARGGVCRAPTLTRRAVGFYPAVSPLPDPEEDPGHRRSVFCGTFPRPQPRGGWVLPTTVSCRARTFLRTGNARRRPHARTGDGRRGVNQTQRSSPPVATVPLYPDVQAAIDTFAGPRCHRDGCMDRILYQAVSA